MQSTPGESEAAGAKRYSYNTAGFLIKVESHDGSGWQTQAEMAYDGQGNRYEMTGYAESESVTTQYVLDNGRVITAASGENSTYYLYGMGAVAEYTDAWSYALTDGTGTPRQLVNAAGEVTLVTSYTPWGDTLESYGTGNFSYGYFGGIMDAATGLIYVGSGMYYDPYTGRFLNRSVRPEQSNPYVPYGDPAGAMVAPLALLALLFTNKKKRTKWDYLLIALVMGVTVGMSLAGCGPVGTPTVQPGQTSTATPPANYVATEAATVTVTLPSTNTTPTSTPSYICEMTIPVASDETEIGITIQALVDYIFDNSRHPYKEVNGNADRNKVSEYLRWIMDVSAANELNIHHLAYIYATTFVETQWFNLSEQYDGDDPEKYFGRLYGYGSPIANDLGNTTFEDGYKFMGRGFIHLTGRKNYSKVGENLGVGDLFITEQDLVMQNMAPGRVSIDPRNYITYIAVLGMKEGWFTGNTLSTYDNSTDGTYDYYGARAIINWPGAQGGDPTQIAADLGYDFYDILEVQCPLGGLPAGTKCIKCE